MLDLFLLAMSAAVPLPARVVPLGRRGPEPSDEELVALAIRGRRAAQQALYLRHCGRVRGRALRLLGRSGDVEDVVQDTFVEAFRDVAKLQDPQRFGSWVCGIAVHQVHRRLRRRQLLRRLGLDGPGNDEGMLEVIDGAASPEQLVQLRRLEVSLARLPAKQRIAWVLRHVEGCSLEETAQQCGVSLASVKRHLAAAESNLQQTLFVGGGRDGGE